MYTHMLCVKKLKTSTSTISIVSQLFNKWRDGEYGHYLGFHNNNTGYVFCGATSDDAMVGEKKSSW